MAKTETNPDHETFNVDRMLTVSLKSFIASGDFGVVRGGCTRQELEQMIGPPETHGGGSRKHSYPTIWKYGDIEFFFEPYRRDGYLYMVYFDAFSVPRGWGQLVIEPWVICKRLTQQQGESALRTENIDYRVSAAPDPDCINVVTSSGVVLQFVINQSDECSFPIGLFAVSKQLAEPRPFTQRAK